MQKIRSTFTIDKAVIDELNVVAEELGEKKSHIVEKALTMYYDYIDVAIAEKRLKELDEGRSETVSAEEVYKALGLV
ncbi:ribbon-helix-helix domain-containing protein [Hydrogenimonas sp.]